MKIKIDTELRNYNTFGIAGTIKKIIHIESVEDVQKLVGRVDGAFILGGGSNIIFKSDIEKLILKVDIKGRRLICSDAFGWLIEANAGENWSDFVSWSIQQGWPGLENLAMIPGTVGAAPVQNIGAYGVELKDRFHSAKIIDLSSGAISWLTAEDCNFSYRDSIFRNNKELLIVKVRFFLPKIWAPVIDYPALKNKLNEIKSRKLMPVDIYQAICDLRKQKLPDPSLIGNVGSFFKNPILDQYSFKLLLSQNPNLVFFKTASNDVKISAGWLIEACGWRGVSNGIVGVYEKQALVLINTASPERLCIGCDVIEFAESIQRSVFERFSVKLEIEPVLV